MSAMMNNSKRNRGGRMPLGGRDKRQMYSQQDRRTPRTQNVDKNVNIDGIFKNQRFTHVVFTLVGSNVQVQVKNGKVYEGILKTVSPKGDTVLEFAHMVEDSSNGNNSVSTAPSRERIMDKLIVKALDLVTINAVNVDLEYAVRDSFTDTGISKYNGETKDKEMKELQPWDSEGGVDIGLLEDTGRSSNGWDVNDMFHINATQFNVKSSYDDSLAQYTTKLEKENSEEWKRREEQAMRLAAEIEGSETYKKHIALENGEGDDEEALFSSVVRPNESSIQSSGSGGSGKYIPPNLRSQGGAGMSKPQRGNYSQQNQPSSHSTPPGISRSVSNHQQSPTTAHSTSSSSASDVNNVNGDSQTRSSVPSSTAGPTVTTSPAHNQAQPSSGDKHDHNPQYPKAENKKMMKGRDEKRDEQIKELKEFSSKFKLDDNKDSKESKENKDKDKEKSSSIENKDNISEERGSSSSEKVSEDLPQEKHSVEEKSSVDRKMGSDKIIEVQSSSDSLKPKENPAGKIQLNPNAMEFVPKQQQQQQPPTQQIPTPPRPQTQSPIIQPQPLMNLAQPVFPSLGQQYIMPPANVLVNNSSAAQSQQLPYNVRPTKRAVVSVMKQDYTASAVQAATGAPLLAQSQQYLQYMPMMPPQHTGYHHQVRPQMMSVQTSQTANQRFMTPTSMQGMPPTSLQGAGLDQNNPGAQAGQVFGMMTNPPQPTPMPAHMTHPSQLNQQAHISHLNMTSSQQSNQHIQAPPSGGGHHAHHHPAPSPVLTNSNQQPLNPGQHPPSSGTPQPPPGYQQATLQAHPPLQPSPHNPTSPQNMTPYVYNAPHGHPMQMQQQQQQQHQHQQQQQGSVGGNMGQQMSMSQQSNVPTSVTYSLQAHQAHSHHSPHMQPQYVMMPPHHSGGQMHQFQGHHMAGPGSIQPQIMSQSGVQGIPGQNHGQGPHPPTMQQFIPPGLTAATVNALHARPDHFIVQHLRK